MIDFSKPFEDNTNLFSESDKIAFESALENQKRDTLFEIRETERVIQYLEDQPRYFQAIINENYEEACSIFLEKMNPAWKRADKLGKISTTTFYCIDVSMLAQTAVMCGVPYSIAYTQCYIYLMNLSMANSEQEAFYIAYHALFEYCRMAKEFREKGHLSDIVMSALNFIQTHLHQKLTIDEIAAYVNISPRQLTRKFKSEMKQTVIDYINSQRISESEYILKHSDATIADIALSVGFSSESYYIDVFKSIKGITPKAFRKN